MRNLIVAIGAAAVAAGMTAGGTLSGLPQLRLTTSSGTAYAGDASAWSVCPSANGKSLLFGCNQPFVFVVR